jgi:CRP/FNR family transcriptional regulator, nitrogen oxide reductase regulator
MSDKISERNLISKLDLFLGLSVPDLEVILSEARELSFEEDSFVFYQDDPAERIFVLKSGRVKLYQIADDGQQVLMRVMTPGMMFAAISMVEGAVYPVSAEAAQPQQSVMYWSQEKMLELITRFPPMAINALKILAGHVREFQNRYRELATERVERRLARTVLRLVSQTGRKTEEGVLLDLPLTRQDLAEMTGTTLFTVSRTLSQWESQAWYWPAASGWWCVFRMGWFALLKTFRGQKRNQKINFFSPSSYYPKNCS